MERVWRFSKVVTVLAACALSVLAATGSLRAQTPTGSVVGTVKDAQELPVSGATVTLTNLGTNYTYTSTTSSNGAYQFQSIDYGLYKVSVAAQGFKTAVVNNIKLDAATQY